MVIATRFRWNLFWSGVTLTRKCAACVEGNTDTFRVETVYTDQACYQNSVIIKCIMQCGLEASQKSNLFNIRYNHLNFFQLIMGWLKSLTLVFALTGKMSIPY